MVTRSKLAIFHVFQRQRFFKATRALRLLNVEWCQLNHCIEQEILYCNCFQNFSIYLRTFPLAALKLWKSEKTNAKNILSAISPRLFELALCGKFKCVQHLKGNLHTNFQPDNPSGCYGNPRKWTILVCFFTFVHTESLLLVARPWEWHHSNIQVIAQPYYADRFDLALTVFEILTFELWLSVQFSKIDAKMTFKWRSCREFSR